MPGGTEGGNDPATDAWRPDGRPDRRDQNDRFFSAKTGRRDQKGVCTVGYYILFARSMLIHIHGAG